jgi:unsaturated rhamnogalacturonyl hydrolase
MLVDTLGMLCPFLAAYGRDFKDARATELAKAQLQEFIDRNLDPSSYLPFHGYFAGGPYRLGAHAWGRGVGWYMLGLADTLIELDPAEKGYPELKQALSQAGRMVIGAGQSFCPKHETIHLSPVSAAMRSRAPDMPI